MGLIYVNPEGPNGNPDPLASGRDIRETFGRMAMNDEETAALIIGGHTVGKCHGAVDPEYLGPEPEGCPVEHQGLGWKNSYESGARRPHAHERARRCLDERADEVGQRVPRTTCYKYDWELTTSPAGAQQWTPKNPEAKDTVPDAHDPSKRHAPMMLTSDLALQMDPIYGPIAKRFHENPDELAEAFAKAWYKLLHRDMGPAAATSARGCPKSSCGRTRSPTSITS